MISCGSLGKKEKAKPKPDSEWLTTSHIEFIDQNIKTGITPKQITELLFSKELAGVSNLNVFITPQYRAVHKYIKEKYPEYLVDSESAVNEKYVVPRSLGTVIKKVNKWAGQDLLEGKLTLQHRKFLEKLLNYLASPRFVQNYDSYRSANDKDLFEAEFVRSVWDKPDLTIDEINLYINVCMDYINLKQIDMKKNKVNEMFNDTQEQKDFTGNGNIPVAVLLEGNFKSLYKNRISQLQADSLTKLGAPYLSESIGNAKLIVVADGDMVLNDVSQKQGPLPIGVNLYTLGSQYEYQFANRDFLLNCLEYLTGNEALIATRNKDIVLRLLDSKKIETEKSFWQINNIAVPILLVVLCGFIYQYWRRKKFAA